MKTKQREIKFRFWNEDDKKMVYEINDLRLNKNSSCDVENEDGEFYNITTLMQYTGLKDLNGKEIYEGDIVNHGIYTDNDKPCNWQVVWDERHSAFVEKEIREFGLSEVSIDNKDCEVIGNIYENPKLLK